MSIKCVQMYVQMCLFTKWTECVKFCRQKGRKKMTEKIGSTERPSYKPVLAVLPHEGFEVKGHLLLS